MLLDGREPVGTPESALLNTCDEQFGLYGPLLSTVCLTGRDPSLSGQSQRVQLVLLEPLCVSPAALWQSPGASVEFKQLLNLSTWICSL